MSKKTIWVETRDEIPQGEIWFIDTSKIVMRCIICGSNKVEYNDFTDSVSRKEFRISRMCQECQDKLWDEWDSNMRRDNNA